ncbi:MAG: ABC transporter ATP-binding protein [Deferrisomatales bacterium]|nr:ABC transporter ATP-binding protein [Deferrisomatales bacterium]
MEPLLEAVGVRKVFVQGGARLEVLKGIDLTVGRGECLAVVGASGVGKSTLLHILGALDRPTEGQVRFRGEDVFGRPETDLAAFRNRHVGFVFQFHHLLAEFSALENAAMPARISGRSREEAQGRARDILEAVGLGARLTHRPGELSGGEQQRVALARALVLDPALVLADEPTGNLDERTGEAVHRLMLDWNRRTGTALVVVTHNRELAESMDRIVTLSDGRVADEKRKAR